MTGIEAICRIANGRGCHRRHRRGGVVPRGTVGLQRGAVGWLDGATPAVQGDEDGATTGAASNSSNQP